MLHALGLALSLAAPAGECPEKTADEIAWRSDLAVACDEAKASRRPLFVVFRCER